MVRTVLTVAAAVAVTMGSIAGLTSCRDPEPGTSVQIQSPRAEPIDDGQTGAYEITPTSDVGPTSGIYRTPPNGKTGFGLLG